EGCDLLILFLKIKIKRSQPAAAPTVKSVKSVKSVKGPLCGFFGARVITNCLTSREDLAITQSLGCVP
ncbi:hypothetical protein SOP85_09860, partial [Pseudomonas sp. YuFO20]|uniref:hypothetical protein n=1 Tax=Pseudomonas sp. YuFO20 TaxID=3095362 RepID=UPI002B24573F